MQREDMETDRKGNREHDKKKDSLERRIRADGQRSNEYRKFRPRQNSHSNRSDDSSSAYATLDYQSLFKFHAAETEIRAKSVEFLLDAEEIWGWREDEKKKREAASAGKSSDRWAKWATCQINTNPSSIAVHLHLPSVTTPRSSLSLSRLGHSSSRSGFLFINLGSLFFFFFFFFFFSLRHYHFPCFVWAFHSSPRWCSLLLFMFRHRASSSRFSFTGLSILSFFSSSRWNFSFVSTRVFFLYL